MNWDIIIAAVLLWGVVYIVVQGVGESAAHPDSQRASTGKPKPKGVEK